MKRLRISRYAKKRLTIAGPLLLGAGLMLHSCGEAEAEPQADPAEVQRFLTEMEAASLSAGSIEGEERKDSGGDNLREFVEGAATRAPSDATVNRIETVMTRRLS